MTFSKQKTRSIVWAADGILQIIEDYTSLGPPLDGSLIPVSGGQSPLSLGVWLTD